LRIGHPREPDLRRPAQLRESGVSEFSPRAHRCLITGRLNGGDRETTNKKEPTMAHRSFKGISAAARLNSASTNSNTNSGRRRRRRRRRRRNRSRSNT
jgi:hypothetical protein